MAIRIPIITDFQGDGLKKTFEEFKKLETNSERASFALKKAFIPATAALAGLTAGLAMSAKAAAEDQAAQVQLARQLQATTGATDKQIKANEDFVSTLSRSAAVADDELRPALASLVRGTGDLASAQDALKTVLDVSAATGKGVQEVADAVSKAYAGNTKAIKQLSPELYQLIKDGASVDEVMQSLASTFGGAASTAANTAQGKFKNLTIQLGEAKEAIGTALLPVVEIMVGAFTNFAVWAQKNAGVILGIATAIGAIAAAIVGTNIALAAWKTVSVITIGINYALAASFTAVQVATGVGIAVVIAGVAAFALYKRQMNGLKDDLGGVATQQGLTNQQMQRMSDAGKLATESVTELKDASSGAGGAVDKMAEKIKKAREELNDQFTTALDNAKGKLEEAKKAYDDFKGTVAESVTGEFSISGAADAAKEAGTTILAQLTQQATGAQAFSKKVEQLLTMGLSEDALRAVLEAGQEAGGAIANELILGGSEAITGPTGINQLVSDLNYVADALGTLAADKFYKAGVTQGEQYLAGVQSAIQAAEMLLKNPNLKLADVKGIGAKFASTVSGINTGAPASASNALSPLSPSMRGGDSYTVNINGGVMTNAQTGKVVIDAVKSFNRASGPADIAVRPIAGRY
jgi:hypothetical protein